MHSLDHYTDADMDRQEEHETAGSRKALVYTYSSMVVQRIVYCQVEAALQAGNCKPLQKSQ